MEEMNKRLIRSVTLNEVHSALFQMDPNTSPGPDDMTTGFFQKYWEVLGRDLTDAIQSFMFSGKLLKGVGICSAFKGLRQGDPLSPFLFLLCGEGLSTLLQQAEENRSIKGGIANIKRILELYGRASGQLINYAKSCCFSSSNTTAHVWDRLSQLLSIRRDTHLGNYLGLPTDLSQTRYKVFSYMKDGLRGKTDGWNEVFLNLAGKEVMLKSVALALPSYAMSCVKLPAKLCNELNVMMAKLWWGS
ncbi:hypothetical protein RHSIM_Rhsim02G0113700 [Rhododendron simsii]|uniref:Reverse transcriptase domain-containing protein n=1 Tax=Rhododendron simsii TaxID=118357 RepID=A0A834HAC9_RHOSS|nr:hypothetical protein RHSIM_Rhsim02G0113700 [Rhododendron simsii]